MQIVDKENDRSPACRAARFRRRRGQRAFCSGFLERFLARGSGNHLFEESGSYRLTVDFEYELILAQAVDELPLLIDNDHAGLDQFGRDPYDFVGWLLLLGKNELSCKC